MEEFQLSTGTCAIITNCTKEITININVDFRVYVVDPVVGKISLIIQTGDKIYGKGEFTSRWCVKKIVFFIFLDTYHVRIG